MDSIFTEISDSEATSVVGGRYVIPSTIFKSVNAFAGAKAFASTTFVDTGYTQTFATADTFQNDFSSSAEAVSESEIYYSSEPLNSVFVP